jgi:hypothetical protein
MASSSKPEFPPLLPLGLHPMSVAEIRGMCVGAFPLSNTRDEIMRGLETLVGALAGVQVPTEVWVDGSFLTQKVNPEDVDVVLCMQGEAYDNGTQEQRNMVDVVRKVDLKPPLHCHSFVFFEYPESHPLSGRASGTVHIG